MSWITDTRTAVADALEALPAFEDLTILREWVPEIDREKLTELEIHIAPLARRSTLQSRCSTLNAIDVSIGFVDPANADPNQKAAKAEAEQDLVDAMIAAMLGKRVGTFFCPAVEQSTITDVDHWRESECVSTFVNLTLET